MNLDLARVKVPWKIVQFLTCELRANLFGGVDQLFHSGQISDILHFNIDILIYNNSIQ